MRLASSGAQERQRTVTCPRQPAFFNVCNITVTSLPRPASGTLVLLNTSKVDLHLHSRFSNRPAEWILRRLNLPDSYSEPKALYKKLKSAGMEFVTLTDHDSIDGCLELLELPGTFISEEVSTFFPEDRCQVHLLAWNITEAQHSVIQQLRPNIYELQAYLQQQAIPHGVAHPLYRLDDRFTPVHAEKLLLLFRCFETVNGLRDSLPGATLARLLHELTPEKIEKLANRHKLAPSHPEPWRKVGFGGSDDHGSLFAGSVFTAASKCKSPTEFFAHVEAGRCTPHGKGGNPLAISHTLYKTVYSFVGQRFLSRQKKHSSLVKKIFSRFMEGRDPTEFSLREKLGFVGEGILSGQIFELAKPANASLWKELSASLSGKDLKKRITMETAGIVEPERRAFIIANLFANQLAFRFFTNFVQKLSGGNIIEAIQELSILSPIALLLSPYLYAFHTQSASRKWLAELCNSLGAPVPKELRNEKRAWFTDTLEDVNGVAKTIRKMTAAANHSGKDLLVVTSRASLQIEDIPIKNFHPIGEFELPEYELQKLSFPPILQMIEFIQREKFTELIISTPGPVGITALFAAKILGLRTSGIYHTDFPQYVRILTDDSFLETLTWNFMHWFYSQLDLLYVNSEHYRSCWIQRGIAAERIQILPRGLETSHFTPAHRDRSFWKPFGIGEQEVVLLFVGRISKEKDLDLLTAAYQRLQGAVRLVLVGDGPYLKQLKKEFPSLIYTGYLSGTELAKAFASADIFAFPSTTDTFGNVILEAMASGLPCVVSDIGGPRELVEHGKTGFITRALDLNDFTKALSHLASDHALRQQMGQNARAAVAKRDWQTAAERFWALSAQD